MRIYFDTNVLRYFSTAFGEKELAADLQANIVLSPVSALELMSQLCDDTATQAFAAVQAMFNWLPAEAKVLDIPPVFIRVNVTGNSHYGQDTFERLTNALNRCLRARSAEDLRDASKQLRSYLQRAKLSDARTRQELVLTMRGRLRRAHRKTIDDNELRDGFLRAIAIRSEVGPEHAGVAEFVTRIEAYYQHETVTLRRAIENPNINLISRKRQNDLFDAEQLLYLAVPELCFLSTDRRAYQQVQSFEQGSRIHIVRPESLMSSDSAADVIRHVLAGNKSIEVPAELI